VADETALVANAAAGDPDAFGLLAEKCRPWLFGLCFRLVRDHWIAHDLVQETLLRAFRDLHQLRDPEGFRSWLSRIATNACLMHLRWRLSRPAELHAEVGPALGEQRGEETPPGVREALEQLRSRDRRLLLLFYGEGLSHAELAETLSLSASAVKSRLHRARTQLRKEMLAMMTEEERSRLGAAEPGAWELRTVLLVEPDEEIRSSLLQGLREAGYEVLMLPTGEAALQAVAQRRGQMLILDKHCVEPHWTEVLLMTQLDAWARENVPVGVLVDAANERDRLLAWQGGAVLCLTRPPEAVEVVRYVDRIGKMWGKEMGPQGGKQDPCPGRAGRSQ